MSEDQGVTGEGAEVCKGAWHKSSKERRKLGRQQEYSKGNSKGKGVVSGKDLKKHAWSCRGGPEQSKRSIGDKDPPGDSVLNITDFASALKECQ